MANVLSLHRQIDVLHHLVEGTSIRSTERLTGVHRDTIMRLLVRAGNDCRALLDEQMMRLSLEHLELDEIWTYVYCKARRIPVDIRRDEGKIGDQYLFIALDQKTKLIPCYALGKRTADNARRFLMDLRKRLVTPNPHASDAHAFQPEGYDPICQLSSDAFPGYPEAVDLAFGSHVQYGQLIKSFRNVDMPGRYNPGEIVNADRRCVKGRFDPETICTSYVERNNLTIRTFMKRFNRLTIGFSKKLENLSAAVALHVAHYNFCRRHGSLRITPAMAAGVTNTLWSLADLIERSRS